MRHALSGMPPAGTTSPLNCDQANELFASTVTQQFIPPPRLPGNGEPKEKDLLNQEADFAPRRLGSGWGRLLSSVPVTQCRKQKDGRHAGKSASDKENAVGVNESVRGAQAFDLSPGKPLQYLSQPGIG